MIRPEWVCVVCVVCVCAFVLQLHFFLTRVGLSRFSCRLAQNGLSSHSQTCGSYSFLWFWGLALQPRPDVQVHLPGQLRGDMTQQHSTTGLRMRHVRTTKCRSGAIARFTSSICEVSLDVPALLTLLVYDLPPFHLWLTSTTQNSKSSDLVKSSTSLSVNLFMSQSNWQTTLSGSQRLVKKMQIKNYK